MKDQRVVFLRKAFDGLLESLDATLRIARWSGTESVPEPLQLAATQLLDRLGAANRLAAGKFAGSPVVVSSMTAISTGIQRLDLAFVDFRRTIAGTAAQKEESAQALDAELDAVRADAAKWT